MAPGTIVLADDAQSNLDVLAGILTRAGHAVYTARDGAEALAITLRMTPDVVVTDVVMPRMDGFELCRQLKQNESTRFVPVILVTGLDGTHERIAGIEAGADDFLTKPVNAYELQARVRSLVRLKRYTDELDSAESVILSLALTVEARDPYTGGHCARMASYASLFGKQLGLTGEEVLALFRGGYVHDLGKIGVPDAILHKTSRLTPEEVAVMRRHAVIGDQLCGNLRLLQPVRSIVRSHHERRDGSGYPDGLRGDEIPLLAQITGIVDVYDALTTTRPYRSALPPETAVAELEKEAQRGLHRLDLVRAFATLCREGQLAQRTRRHSDLQVIRTPVTSAD